MQKDEIKEIYLSNLEWTKTHDNMGGVNGNIIFKNSISLKEFEKILENTYFILCDKDYITNLQEELKELCDKYEKEHSTTFNEWKETITDKYQTLKNLQEENERLHRELDEVDEYNKDLIFVINEAKKYNKKVLTWWTNEDITDEIAETNLKILNGGDEE